MLHRLIGWIARHLPSCEQVTQRVSESLDRDLSLGERLAVRFHVLMCVFCARYERQLRLIRAALRGRRDRLEAGDAAQAPALSPEARARIQRSLRDGDR